MVAGLNLPVLLAVTVSVRGRTMTVRLDGDLDCISADLLRDFLARELGSDLAQLVFDLAGLRFLDCAGARVLARAGQYWPGVQRPVLRSPSRIVLRVLQLTGLDSQLTIETAAPEPDSAPPPRPDSTQGSGPVLRAGAAFS